MSTRRNPLSCWANRFFDSSRAPAGKHTAWGYCHVPNGSTVDMTESIERQVERFAPGFKDCVLARHTFTTHELEAHNPNLVGGDISGGSMDSCRPGSFARRGAGGRTASGSGSLCSAATPPGPGVHGMCGFHAATMALRDFARRRTAPGLAVAPA